MAYQLSTVRSKVQTRLKDSNFTSATIDSFINDTQNDVANEYDLRFFEKTQAYTLTTNTEDITDGNGLPTDFVRTIDLVNTTSGFEKRLEYIDYRELDLKYPSWSADEAGVPKYFYMYADTIYVYPKPDQAYTLRLRYLKRPIELSGDSDVPEIPKEFEELLVYGATARAWETKDRFDKAAIYENKYLREVMKLVDRYSKRQSSTPHQMAINVSRSRNASYFS